MESFTDNENVIVLDLETSVDFGNLSTYLIDMMHKKCSCGKGDFREMYLQDDWSGILHCNICNKETNRYISVSEYREEQINKILDE